MMAFQRFYNLYPDLAVNETRSITLLQAEYGLPAGEYAFIGHLFREGIDRGRVSHAVNRAARERKQQQKRAAAKKAQKAARKRNCR